MAGVNDVYLHVGPMKTGSMFFRPSCGTTEASYSSKGCCLPDLLPSASQEKVKQVNPHEPALDAWVRSLPPGPR